MISHAGLVISPQKLASCSVSQKTPIFLVIIGKNVVHWDRAGGCGAGLRVWLSFSTCFMAWDHSYHSSVPLFNSKMGLVTSSYLG